VLTLAAAPGVLSWSVVSHARPRWVRQRIGDVAMLEAYDLMPIMDCLKEANQDAVNACFDNISPWLQVTDDGDVVLSQGAINGFLGGSVGAVGTLIATFVKRDQVKDRLKCPYCEGTGIIQCGRCLGSSQLASRDASGALSYAGCQYCESSGTVVCINCQGSGLNVPDDFVQALGDTEQGFSEDDYIGLFDEVKFPTSSPPRDMPNAAPAPAAPAAPAEKTRDASPSEKDGLTLG